MLIRGFELPPIGTNAFLFSKDGHAVLFDAPGSAWETVQPILEAESLTLDALILTHGHWDHIVDASVFQENGIPVWAHAGDQEWIEDPAVMALFMPPDMIVGPTKLDRVLAHSETVELLGQQVEIRHVPGHAPGNIIIYFPEEKACVVGDAIFAGSVGRPDLPGGDWATLEKAIKEQIFTLPDETTLYCGHGPETTVAREKTTNPYVSG
ncbi:MAG: MBL fold metallo-hydrolase [Verrucomicrobiota bacterium]